MKNQLKILCPFCGKEWTTTMKLSFEQISSGCDTCGYGAETQGNAEIYCKKLIYKKEYKKV